MTGARELDPDVLSVSIVAGPSASALLDTIGTSQASGRSGLLSSRKPEAPWEGLTFFQLAPDANPNQIVEEIRRIAGTRKVDYLVIECESDRPPMAYASLFAVPEHLPQSLNDIARLTGTAYAIQPSALGDAVLGHRTSSLPASFVAEQIEFVSDLFLEGVPGDNDFDLARAIALTLNPRAQIMALNSPDAQRWHERRGTSFDFDAALNGAGWRQLLDHEQPTLTPDKKITAFGYRARRPFHPERFWNLLQHDLRGVFRAKGFFWLATRMDEVGGLNLAGTDLHCASAGAWWAARDQASRESEMPERTRAEWKEPFGDRRQTFALMALDLDRATLQSQLDACLLTDSELAGGPDSWKGFADPFPSWSPDAHAHHHHHHECDHDHGSEEHDCCHH
jgi:G3E family GTPase